MPTCTGCILDTGSGYWFFRVGVWGEEKKIEWSGIVGPFMVISKNVLVPLPPPTLKVIHTEALQGGVRMHTGNLTGYYTLIEYSTEPEFKASETKMLWDHDWGRGYVDCTGLLYEYTYFIRISSFHDDISKMPEGTIKPMAAPMVMKSKKPAKPVKYTTAVDYVKSRADEAVLKDMHERKNARFNSYSDYIRFLEAQARTIQKKER
jgi:hypothetical protein